MVNSFCGNNRCIALTPLVGFWPYRPFGCHFRSIACHNPAFAVLRCSHKLEIHHLRDKQVYHRCHYVASSLSFQIVCIALNIYNNRYFIYYAFIIIYGLFRSVGPYTASALVGVGANSPRADSCYHGFCSRTAVLYRFFFGRCGRGPLRFHTLFPGRSRLGCSCFRHRLFGSRLLAPAHGIHQLLPCLVGIAHDVITSRISCSNSAAASAPRRPMSNTLLPSRALLR